MYVCEAVEVVNGLETCRHFIEYTSFIPQLTDDVRDQLLLIELSAFIAVFIIQRVKELLNIGGGH